MQNDSVSKTLIVAFSLCVFCSILVSTAAIKLKDQQMANKKMDIKRNLLLATKLIDSPKVSQDKINEAYTKVKPMLVNLESGEEVTGLNAEDFDPVKEAKEAKYGIEIPSNKDIGRIKRRSSVAKIYLVKDDAGQTTQIVLPVYGKGLWSTLYGFLALAPDTVTIKGLGFYDHGETPGLGGEVDNPSWKALWNGKKGLDSNYAPQIEVIKGSVNESTPGADHKIDGLSGATLTSNGVRGLINYWLGDHGYGTVLAKFRTAGGNL